MIRKKTDSSNVFRVVGDLRYISDPEILRDICGVFVFRELYSSRMMREGKRQLESFEVLHSRVVKAIDG